MAQPWKHPKTGIYYFRRGVPAELRARIDKVEWKVSLRTKNLEEAKRLYLGEAANCEAAFARARRGTSTLSHKDRVALSRYWLTEQLAEQEENPREAEYYRIGLSDLVADLDRPGLTWLPYVEKDLNKLLLDQGLQLDSASAEYLELAQLLAESKAQLWGTLANRAEGLYQTPAMLENAPEWSGKTDPSKTLRWAFDQWIAETNPARKTALEYGNHIRNFGDQRAITSITLEDVQEVKEQAQKAGKAPVTVQKRVLAIRAALGWAYDHRHLKENVAANVHVKGTKARKNKRRPVLPFTIEEATALLLHARTQQGALRWLPWLMASTGCRLTEAAQPFKDDVVVSGTIPYLRITDEGEGQALKTYEDRSVPLHPLLVAEGFLEYVSEIPEGSRLFPEISPDSTGSWGGNIGRKLRLVIKKHTDRQGLKNHSWRHFFITCCREAGIDRETRDAITGHRAADAGADYGEQPLAVLASALAKVNFGAPPLED